jgi:hypothetical protein
MNQWGERIRALPLEQRRRVLQALSLLLVAPIVPRAACYTARKLSPREAHAQPAPEPTLFLEFNFRDQVDLMHVMVPPSIARHGKLSVGDVGAQITMYAGAGELKEYPNNVFLTADSSELSPHVDTIAMLDTGEQAIGGVHGHEACNGMRSPGRVMDGGVSGQPPLWLNDGAHAAGSEELYGAVPTPASFHNFYQKRLSPDLRNGFAFKGISRYKHSVYHYGAGYPGADLTRVHSRAQLFELYGDDFEPHRSALPQEIMQQPDVPYRKQAGAGYAALADRFGALLARRIEQLELTPEEVERWSSGVPPQQCTKGDAQAFPCGTDENVNPDGEGFVKAQVWEQFAYASKLFRSGRVRSIALEFDFMDLAGDTVRTEMVVRTQAQQVARPLARLIADLKAAGLYDRSVIAVYTLDGSRGPGANSYGDLGKNTLLLAGGRIRGGYYGDILVSGDVPAGGHTYALRPPDPETGELLPAVQDWSDRSARTPSGCVWRTVVKAMGIPEYEYVGKFNSEIDDTRPLDFMLRG